MKMPISFKDFAKDPVKGLLFIVLLAVGYLYYDNKASYQKQTEEYKSQYADCGTKVEALEKKLDEKTERLRRADSVMAISVARLEVLNEINKIK
jgi:predicted negative regulator of RcsB-dependent stress response